MGKRNLKNFFHLPIKVVFLLRYLHMKEGAPLRLVLPNPLNTQIFKGLNKNYLLAEDFLPQKKSQLSLAIQNIWICTRLLNEARICLRTYLITSHLHVNS